MSKRPEKRKVEFIESYWTGGEYGSDYHWDDNHGEIIRCKDCKHWSEAFDQNCMKHAGWFQTTPDWFCADGESKGTFDHMRKKARQARFEYGETPIVVKEEQ